MTSSKISLDWTLLLLVKTYVVTGLLKFRHCEKLIEALRSEREARAFVWNHMVGGGMTRHLLNFDNEITAVDWLTTYP